MRKLLAALAASIAMIGMASTADATASCPTGSEASTAVVQSNGSYMITQAPGNPLVTFDVQETFYADGAAIQKVHLKSKGNSNEIVDVFTETTVTADWAGFGSPQRETTITTGVEESAVANGQVYQSITVCTEA